MHKHAEKGLFLIYHLNRLWTAVKLEGNGGKHLGRFIPLLEYAKPDAASVSRRKYFLRWILILCDCNLISLLICPLVCCYRCARD